MFWVFIGYLLAWKVDGSYNAVIDLPRVASWTMTTMFLDCRTVVYLKMLVELGS